MRIILFLFIIVLTQSCILSSKNQYKVSSSNIDLIINNDGSISFVGKDGDKTYTRKDTNSYFFRLKYFDAKEYELPTGSTWKKDKDSSEITLSFSKSKAKIKLVNKGDYFTVELIELTNESKVELISWGPYRFSLSEKIGKSIGIVYDDSFAVGLMGLNLKSCGGFEIEHRERFGNTAQKEKGGAVLHGFTRNRSQSRKDDNCLQELTEAIALQGDEASLIGSKFAIYGSPTDKLKSLIPEIEKNEGLPYLTHNGEWLKNSSYATSSKFIMNYSLENIDKCLDIAERAGITCVYHPDVFESWGKYPVKKNLFPNGYKSVRVCNEKAKKRNITLGAHTLSNFITKNDPLVTPKPDSRLQLAGLTTLKSNISKGVNRIELKDENLRKAYDKDDLERTQEGMPYKGENKNREIFAILIGNEIIEFSSVSTEEGNLILEECKRGAFGTTPSSHHKNEQVGRLVSHYYQVFFGNLELQDEVAKNLANFFNKTGLERISFDGIEGALATGHGRYSGDRFIKTFFDHLNNKNIIANSSDVMHYAWHYFANESWGEPWWAKNFRESQLGHRIKVQKELEEDLLPRKMGQFSITAKTTLHDIQWVMGLCTGYESGVDFYISPNFLKENPKAEIILKEIRRWEKVRENQSLSVSEKKILRDPFSFYTLKIEHGKPELVFEDSWTPQTGKMQGDTDRNTLPKGILNTEDNANISFNYTHMSTQKEPGQPTFAEWEYFSKGKEQNLQFAIRLKKNSQRAIEGLYLKIGANRLDIPFSVKPGEYITFQNEGRLIHHAVDGKELEVIRTKPLKVKNGKNIILFDYKSLESSIMIKTIVNFKSMNN